MKRTLTFIQKSIKNIFIKSYSAFNNGFEYRIKGLSLLQSPNNDKVIISKFIGLLILKLLHHLNFNPH